MGTILSRAVNAAKKMKAGLASAEIPIAFQKRFDATRHDGIQPRNTDEIINAINLRATLTARPA
jgi:hypothetical protein